MAQIIVDHMQLFASRQDLLDDYEGFNAEFFVNLLQFILQFCSTVYPLTTHHILLYSTALYVESQAIH